MNTINKTGECNMVIKAFMDALAKGGDVLIITGHTEKEWKEFKQFVFNNHYNVRWLNNEYIEKNIVYISEASIYAVTFDRMIDRAYEKGDLTAKEYRALADIQLMYFQKAHKTLKYVGDYKIEKNSPICPMGMSGYYTHSYGVIEYVDVKAFNTVAK